MMEDDELIKKMQKDVDKIMHARNAAGIEDFDNLSPNDMSQLMYFLFEENCSIGIRKSIPALALSAMPFLNLVVDYMEHISEEKEVKLTKLGNLPRKLVFKLYETGHIKEFAIEKGITKLSKEDDVVSIQNVKILTDLMRVTKNRNNKVSLTKKGTQLLNPEKRYDLFKELFVTHCRKFNLGYHDGWSQDIGIQKTFGYTLYLLIKYGKEKRGTDFYGQKSIKAFPFELGHFDTSYSSPIDSYTSCLNSRIFDRFLSHYGLIDYDDVLKTAPRTILKTTPLFDAVFEFRKDKLLFHKSQFFA